MYKRGKKKSLNKGATRALISVINKKICPKSKRSQITLFVIVAILIVVAVLLFFLFRGKIRYEISYDIEKNPEAFIDSCIEPKVMEAAELISQQGGYISPEFYRKYEGVNIAYLCYNVNNYLQCVNQQPMLIQHIKKEIYNYIKDDVENCFQELKLNLEKQDAEVVLGDITEFEVILKSKKIIIPIKRDLTITKADASYKFEKFNSVTRYPIYDLALVVQEIVNQEARFCNFVQEGYMIFYNRFDREIVYTVTDRQSQKYFRFAVKGCTTPPAM